MTLLLSQVDTNTISIVGSWRSNSILCYLHTYTQTFAAGLAYALIMTAHGG